MNKYVIIFFIFSLQWLISCGGKSSQQSDAKISLTNNFIVAGQTGGVLLFGRIRDGAYKFTAEISNDQYITLDNGTYDFFAIAWQGPSPLMGKSRCAMNTGVSISPTEANVSLSLSSSNCLTANQLAVRIFGDLYQTTYPDQFKTINLHTCDVVSSSTMGCATSVTDPVTGSFTIQFRSHFTNQPSQSKLESSCHSISPVATGEKSNATAIRLPASDTLEMITRPVIILHTSTDCSDQVPVYYVLEKGLTYEEDQINGNYTLISDIDTSAPDTISIYLEHNSNTSNTALGSALAILSNDLPATISDYLAISSVDVEISGLSDNDQIYLYLNDSTCSNDGQALLELLNVGIAPVDLNTFSSHTLPSSPLMSSGGILNYYLKINNSIGAPLTFSSQNTCELVGTVSDTAFPIAATGLAWPGGSHTNISSVTVSWSPSSSVDLAKQSIVYWLDPSCISSQVTENFVSKVATNDTFTGTDGNTYYFSVRSYDLSGNITDSACSPGLAFDMTPPNNATSLIWNEVSPSVSTDVNPTWIPSNSPDVNDQVISFYLDPACTSLDGAALSLGNAASTTLFNGMSGTSYYYSIETWDFAGNVSVSPCSPVMEIQ